jgi:hypothetical protein
MKFLDRVMDIDNDKTLSDVQKRKAFIELDMSLKPNIDVLYEIETIKLRLECLPGGNAYETLVKQHPCYIQLAEKNAMMKTEIDALSDIIARGYHKTK